jgi:hypothetical protein
MNFQRVAVNDVAQALAPLGFGLLIEPMGRGVVAVSSLLSLAALVACQVPIIAPRKRPHLRNDPQSSNACFWRKADIRAICSYRLSAAFGSERHVRSRRRRATAIPGERNAERFRGFEIDHEGKLARLLDREIAGPGASKDLAT